MKTRLLVLVMALLSVGATPAAPPQDPLITLIGLAENFEQNAVSNYNTAGLFTPDVSVGGRNATAFFQGRADAYEEAAKRIRREIGWQYPQTVANEPK